MKRTSIVKLKKAELIELIDAMTPADRSFTERWNARKTLESTGIDPDLYPHLADPKPTLKQHAAASFDAAKQMVSNASKACGFEERLALAKRKARETGTTLRLF